MERRRRDLNRRTVLAAALGSAVPVAAHAAAPETATARPQMSLDPEKPEDNLYAWMKMRASLVAQDVYYWFTGTLDVAVPGEPIAPIIAVETLILRRTEPQGGNRYHVTDWEASFYRDPRTGAIAREVVNPITRQLVQPLHYREGPVTFEYAADRQPRLVGLPTPFAEKNEPFRQPWRIAGDAIWMVKDFYIWGRPQWLDIGEFPEETPSTPLNVSSIATMRSRLADVLDPTLPSVETDYYYQATSDFLPWMKLGKRPGFLVWHEAGKKFFRLDDVPAETLAAVRELHPLWWNRPRPWESFTNMFLMYKEQRSRKS